MERMSTFLEKKWDNDRKRDTIRRKFIQCVIEKKKTLKINAEKYGRKDKNIRRWKEKN
jgi:hypothetical protein